MKMMTIEEATPLVREGAYYHKSGDIRKAEKIYIEVLERCPNHPDNLHLLGLIYQFYAKHEEAMIFISKAISLNRSPHYFLSLGNNYSETGQFRKAIACFRLAYLESKEYLLKYKAVNNISLAYRRLGKFRISEAAARKAIGYWPQGTNGHWNLGYSLTMQGKLAEGWDEFEKRWDTPEKIPGRRGYDLPWWQGEDLKDKAILVWGEQGPGDQVCDLSMLSDLTRIAGKVYLEVDRRMIPLAARSFPGVTMIHPGDSMPDVAFHSSLGHLARFLRRSIKSFPRTSFLVPNQEKTAFWRRELAGKHSIGISWRSMKMNEGRHSRYFSVRDLAPLKQPGTVLVNLQYALTDQDKQEIQDMGILMPNLDLLDDFDGIAALISALDCIVAPNNLIGMMAGALGTRAHIPTLEDDPTLILGEMLCHPPTLVSHIASWEEGIGVALREAIQAACGETRVGSSSAPL